MIKEFTIIENINGLLSCRLSFNTKAGDTLTTENLPKDLIEKLEIVLKGYINEEYKDIAENKIVDEDDIKILKLFAG